MTWGPYQADTGLVCELADEVLSYRTVHYRVYMAPVAATGAANACAGGLLKETAAGSRVMLVAACAHAHGARQLVSVGADSEPIVLRIAATQIRPRFTADAHAK